MWLKPQLLEWFYLLLSVQSGKLDNWMSKMPFSMASYKMSQPPDFIDPQYPQHVRLLKKSLYDLKQALRAWFDRFSMHLLHLGFICSKTDPSLFTLQTHKGKIFLLLYVDDIIVTGSNPSHVSELVLQLGNEFAMKDFGPLHFFLGVEMKYFEGGIHLNQNKYDAELLTKTEMTLAKVVFTPLAQKHGLHEVVGSLVNASLYIMIVGSLRYLTLTRPDITHAVNLASQFMQSLNIEHLQGVKMILRYIKGTLHFGLRIISQSPCTLYVYSDADRGGCTSTRRSTTGYSIYLGANCFSWTSKKQTTIARSSAEDEYRTLASTAAEMTWILYPLHDLGVFLRSVHTLYCDNMSALYMTVNPVMHARTNMLKWTIILFVRK
ncbi:uncharacterized mitochondrial protein AtMg00810-like [Solanum verrucosum]|uniref:uncharacterized mitochondrial protein AtMg00810-like n=1 Tax=Solanum verrucosum TaxID=315347 RepID=UPI0020D16056|nr:uncharacterized mitochondrial protein AtMg00810-like [Solanum verrucosum]